MGTSTTFAMCFCGLLLTIFSKGLSYRVMSFRFRLQGFGNHGLRHPLITNMVFHFAFYHEMDCKCLALLLFLHSHELGIQAFEFHLFTTVSREFSNISWLYPLWKHPQRRDPQFSVRIVSPKVLKDENHSSLGSLCEYWRSHNLKQQKLWFCGYVRSRFCLFDKNPHMPFFQVVIKSSYLLKNGVIFNLLSPLFDVCFSRSLFSLQSTVEKEADQTVLVLKFIKDANCLEHFTFQSISKCLEFFCQFKAFSNVNVEKKLRDGNPMT